MSKIARAVLWAVAAAVAIGFVWTVWPTPYIYHYLGDGNAVRENRFTGQFDLITPHGWKRVDPPDPR